MGATLDRMSQLQRDPANPGHPPQPSALRRFLIRIYGPAELGVEHQRHPLEGTRWDPALEAARKEARRREKLERRQGKRTLEC